MSGVYGIENYDFDYVYQMIKTLGNKVKINDTERAEVVILTDKEYLIRNIDKINKLAIKKTFLVFGSQVFYKDFNLEFIDVITKVKLKSLINRKNTIELQYKKVDIVKKLLKKSKVSVIKNILTLLYKIQNKESREAYRKLIFIYLNSEEDNIEKLEKSLILLSKKKSSTLTGITDIIKSEIFKKTHHAVMQRKKGIDEKTKISSFDINYILSFKK